MLKLIDLISREVSGAFSAAGYDEAYGKVTVSNRPDLCEYQCNGALPAAKVYHKPPMAIAEDVAAQLAGNANFERVEACRPGFINLRLSPASLADYLEKMRTSERFGVEPDPAACRMIIDYGGPNVAKPLHVGHLRSAIIGESLKRIFRFFGNDVVGDIHMGDWGLQMGLIIAELRERHPELPYFDEAFAGEYPAEAPFTIADLEEIYPAASAKSKADEAFAAKAHDMTRRLQEGDRGCRALWEHIMRLSVADLKKNYSRLDVDFELWLGESDAQPYIEPMLGIMQDKGLAQRSDGALVVDVSEPEDTKQIPPCILLKSDGATLYATTDLATLLQRMGDYQPGRIYYVTDKRQNLHFEQVFRAARKAGIVPPEVRLDHLGFGTMNGPDGKPFKTREGGVMRLERLIAEITEFVEKKIEDNQVVGDAERPETARKIAMAALKYGDLSNQPTKDYVFDLDRFAAFEGNTGPYILYTIVRIKSILSRAESADALCVRAALSPEEKAMQLVISRLADNLELACRDSAPNLICAYIYELAGAVNKFYHETRILTEPDPEKKAGFLAGIALAKSVLETCIDLLGFEAPDKM
ncbi:MAG: arginine--tRNA ligase [Ruminococcaceae bacterium]|jgi:arginyl-tRNA synthetase|nr:arginine--tRNA ligase [Oscillospiraceae bacterium]